MRRAFLPFFCGLSALLWSATMGRAQEQIKPVEEHGWGSTWTAPVTDQQRQAQQFVGQCRALEKAGNFRGIIAACDDQLRKRPDFFFAYAVRASALADLKDYDQSLADLDRAKELAVKKDRTASVCSILTYRAKVNVRRNDYRAALNDLRAALKIDRSQPETLNEMAWLLATAPDASFRNGREAISLAKKALAATPRSQSYAVTDTMAAACAEANQYPRAVEFSKQALEEARAEIKDAAKLTKFSREATDRLHLFEQNQSYHSGPPP